MPRRYAARYATHRSRVGRGPGVPRAQPRQRTRLPVFHKDTDYDAFVSVLAQARDHVPIRLIAYCLMPNHFHLAIWPYEDGDLSRPKRDHKTPDMSYAVSGVP